MEDSPLSPSFQAPKIVEIGRENIGKSPGVTKEVTKLLKKYPLKCSLTYKLP